MQFGLDTCLWTQQPTTGSFVQYVERVASAGGDCIEVPVYADSVGFDLREAHAVLQAHAMGVSAVTALWPTEDISDPDAAVARRGVEALRVCIDAAAELGAKVLAGGFYSAAGRLTWRAPEQHLATLDRLGVYLRGLAEHAQGCGITLCLEPLNRYETSLLNTVEQGLALVRRVDHAHCGLLLDTFHLHIEERSVSEAIRAAGSWVRHVHANESHRGCPGTGAIDWPAVRDALHSIAYDGALVIETFDAADAELAAGGRMWHALSPSPDELASEGLRFLRGLMSGHAPSN